MAGPIEVCLLMLPNMKQDFDIERYDHCEAASVSRIRGTSVKRKIKAWLCRRFLELISRYIMYYQLLIKMEGIAP